MSEREMLDNIASSIKYILEQRNMSQRELAYATGISSSSINYYVNAKRMPSIKHIINISIALDCSIDFLVPTRDYIY